MPPSRPASGDMIYMLPRPLCSRVRPDVRDRQTDRQTDRRQTKASLNALPIRGRGIIITGVMMTSDILIRLSD